MSLKTIFASALFGGLVLAVTCWILWTSLDFQECVKSYGQNNPTAEHFEKSYSRVTSTILTYRHCAGAYVVDKNAVITALGTIVIAIFTTVLGVFTVSLAGSTRIAANAADLSARAAIALELPVIRVALGQFGFGSSEEQGKPKVEYCSLGGLGFMNQGRTQALPIEVQCGWTASDKLPSEPIYTFTKAFPVNLILKPGSDTTEWLHIDECEMQLTPDEISKVRRNALGLWFYCRVVYFDFMQNRHQAAFCWRRWDVGTSAWFREDATPAYNQKT